MTKGIDNGKEDVKDIAPQLATRSNPIKISQAGKEIAMLLALQVQEWQELRATSGVNLKLINLQEPTSKKHMILIAIGSEDDEVTGIDETLDVAINGISVDEIVAEIAREGKSVAEIKEKPIVATFKEGVLVEK
jgi:hypothetical protein